MKLQKAAMFGLDARIALAIFGALSVISGAALYSAIQQSKVIAAVTEFNEINKAIESYMIDTGVNLDYSTTTPAYFLKIDELATSSVSGWNGPYISHPVENDGRLDSVNYDNIQLFYVTTPIWPAENHAYGAGKCATTVVDCAYWIMLGAIKNDMANAIDLYVDGTASRTAGKVRMLYPSGDSTSPVSHVFIQGPPTLK